MILKPRKGFSFIVKFIDFFNPVIVLLSIAGLILEYTQYKDYVLFPNRIIDIIFVADFLLRLISFPSGKYFFKAYGWVDFLASIPGFTVFMNFGQYFGLFKVMRIGRFFKIIRVLRFLRIFSFLKKMKGDSAFIQERIMKIGVTIVIVFVTGLGVTDFFMTEALNDLRKESINSVMELSRGKVSKLAERLDNVVYYSEKGTLFNSDGKKADSFSDYEEKLNNINHWYIELRFSDNTIDHGGSLIPVEGILVSADDIMIRHDNIMLIMISSLILILIILIFYIGYIFARDMKIVQLINDSVDAGDYWLLREEAKKYAVSGELAVEEGEDEMISLIKMAAVLAERAESPSGGFTEMAGSMFADAGFSGDLSVSPDADINAVLPEASGIEAGDQGAADIDENTDISSENIMTAGEIPSMSDGNSVSLHAFSEDESSPADYDEGDSIAASDAEPLDREELDEFAEVLPDLSDFTSGDTAVSGFSGSGMQDAEEGGVFSVSEEVLPGVSGIKASDAAGEGAGTLKEKLDVIEQTVNEINSKLSSLENVQGQALETVARDAASRAVKITSKSIGEYIHKKLSGS